MKIERIRATPVNVPLEAPYLWSFGALGGFSKTIVEVDTSDGLTGLGEAISPDAARLIEETLAPPLIGRDPIDIAGAELLCLPSWGALSSNIDYPLIRAFGAIEMALWDIRGKAWGRPVYELLGGAVRKEIPFTDYFGFRERQGDHGGEATAEAVADYCQMLNQEHGTTYFEGKFYTADPRPCLDMLWAIRKRLGDGIMLRIDSNMSYSLATARLVAAELEEIGVRNWEDPVDGFENMAALRKSTRIPFSTHVPDLRRACDLGAPDAMVTDICTHGGFARTVRFIGACEQMGVDFWCYSGDLGIASASYLHLVAAMQHIREPSQSLFRMQHLDVIEEGIFKPKNNLVPVPEGPGLGVTLSRDKLDFLRRHFDENGPYNKYRDPDRPGVLRRLPLS